MKIKKIIWFTFHLIVAFNLIQAGMFFTLVAFIGCQLFLAIDVSDRAYDNFYNIINKIHKRSKDNS